MNAARPVIQVGEAIVLLLPVPPSVNNLFSTSSRPGKGRIKAKHYVAWIKEAGWILQAQRPRAVRGWYVMQVELPDTCKADIDNPLKAANDLLKKHGVIEDDRWCWALYAERTEGLEHCRVTLCERDAVFPEAAQ